LNYYKLLVKQWTTTDKTLDEIYNTGLSEVKRIRTEMENTKNSTGFKGSLDSFFQFMKTDKQFRPFKTAEEVLDSFRHIYEIIKPAVNKYFLVSPKSRFEIRQTEAFRAASASIEYLQGTPDGSRPGVFYVPILDATTFNITSGMESTFLHEAIPAITIKVLYKWKIPRCQLSAALNGMALMVKAGPCIARVLEKSLAFIPIHTSTWVLWVMKYTGQYAWW
jgi:uncharacterized protein (DUF885 family)